MAAATGAAIAVACALEDASDELCRLDAVAGDGDHGLSMARAAKSVRSKLAQEPAQDVAHLFRLMAGEFVGVGGAMGAVAFVMLEAASEVVVPVPYELSAADIVALLDAAQKAVSEFGGARPGDKTIVDAISAARQAAGDSALSGAPALACLLAAAAGARNGAEATAAMIARVGRSSRLGETSLGTVDPGAKSFAISLGALTAWFARRSKDEPTKPI
jgi:dihydroxyacetone kinase-like protein